MISPSSSLVSSFPVIVFSSPATTSGVTNPAQLESPTVGYEDRVMLGEQAKREGVDTHGFDTPNAHTGCFKDSGSKILEGCRRYAVIVVGQKNFNGRITMGTFFGKSLFGLQTLTTPLAS